MSRPTSQYYTQEDGARADGAACGSAATAMLLDVFDRFATTAGIDRSVRPAIGLGGSLLGYGEALRAHGLAASVRMGGSWEDLQRAVDGGFGVAISYFNGSTSHTVRVLAVEKDHLVVQDPAKQGTQVRTLDRAYVEEHWREIPIAGLHTGVARPYLVCGERGATLPDGGSALAEIDAASTNALHDGFMKLATGGALLGTGEVTGGLAKIFAGTMECAAQLPFGILQIAGAGLERLGELSFAAGGVAAFFGAIAYALGVVLRHLGQWLGAPIAFLLRGLTSPLDRLALWASDDDAALADVMQANAKGDARQRKIWEQLVSAPPEQKQRLIDRLESGHVSEKERRAIAIVQEATQMRSYNAAAPWPPPIHIDTTP